MRKLGRVMVTQIILSTPEVYRGSIFIESRVITYAREAIFIGFAHLYVCKSARRTEYSLAAPKVDEVWSSCKSIKVFKGESVTNTGFAGAVIPIGVT